MGRVKEAVLASLARPIVSSVSALWSPSSPAFLLIYTIKYTRIYIPEYIYQNIYTRINIHTRQLCESSTRYRSYGF